MDYYITHEMLLAHARDVATGQRKRHALSEFPDDIQQVLRSLAGAGQVTPEQEEELMFLYSQWEEDDFYVAEYEEHLTEGAPTADGLLAQAKEAKKGTDLDLPPLPKELEEVLRAYPDLGPLSESGEARFRSRFDAWVAAGYPEEIPEAPAESNGTDDEEPEDDDEEPGDE